MQCSGLSEVMLEDGGLVVLGSAPSGPSYSCVVKDLITGVQLTSNAVRPRFLGEISRVCSLLPRLVPTTGRNLFSRCGSLCSSSGDPGNDRSDRGGLHWPAALSSNREPQSNCQVQSESVSASPIWLPEIAREYRV